MKYQTRLADWNTGRLYIGPDKGFGDIFGPVCRGTGSTSITGSNAKNFGRIVCAELGFGSTALKFIGSKNEYEEKFRKQVVDDDRIPDYSVIGASCPVKLERNKVRIEDCQFRDPGFDGGSCLKGVSDIFVHCDTPKKIKAGEWSDWKKSDLPCDPFQDYFTQEFRNCENGVNGYCIGPWLKLTPDCLCVKKQEDIEDYNKDYTSYPYDQGSYDGASYEYADSVTSSYSSESYEGNYESSYSGSENYRKKRRSTRSTRETLWQSQFCRNFTESVSERIFEERVIEVTSEEMVPLVTANVPIVEITLAAAIFILAMIGLAVFLKTKYDDQNSIPSTPAERENLRSTAAGPT